MSTSELHTTVDARRRSIQLVYSEQRQNVLHTPNMRMSEMTSNFWLHLTINNTMQDNVEQQTYTQYVRVFRGYNLPSVCIKVSKYKNGISSFSNQRESTKPALTELIDPCFTHSRSSSFSHCFLTGICFFLSPENQSYLCVTSLERMAQCCCIVYVTDDCVRTGFHLLRHAAILLPTLAYNAYWPRLLAYLLCIYQSIINNNMHVWSDVGVIICKTRIFRVKFILRISRPQRRRENTGSPIFEISCYCQYII